MYKLYDYRGIPRQEISHTELASFLSSIQTIMQGEPGQLQTPVTIDETDMLAVIDYGDVEEGYWASFYLLNPNNPVQ